MSMIGLSIVLEGDVAIGGTKRNPSSFSRIVQRTRIPIKLFPTNIIAEKKTTCGFLQFCLFCKQKLLPDQDIYMYMGDRPFCSVECRSKQIFIDKEETINTEQKQADLIASSSSKNSTS